MILAIFIFSSCPLQNMAMSSRAVRCAGKEGWRLQQFDGTIMKWNRGNTHWCQAQGTNRMSWWTLEPSNDYRWVSVLVSLSCLGSQIGLSYFLTRFKLDRSRSTACTSHHKPSAYLFESCSGPEWKLIISAGASYYNITLSSLVLAEGGSNQSCCETNFVAIKCLEN